MNESVLAKFGQARRFWRLLTGRRESSVIFGVIIVVLFFSIGTKGLWLGNLPNVLVLTALVGVIAIGQALLITAGEVDLSVGSVYAFASVSFLVLMGWGLSVFPSLILALLISAMIGMINGVITVKFNVPSMIVTLGAMFIYRGLVYIITTGYSLSIPREYRGDFLIWLIGGKTYGLSHSVVLLVILTAVFIFLLARMRLGSHILAVGGEPASALANGVSPDRVKTIAFVMCSVLAGTAGIVAACKEGSVYSTTGKLLELDTIAAAVMGGCMLTGGVGSIWGPVLGVFILASMKGGLMMMGAPTSWYIAFVGMILIGFLAASKVTSKQYG
jgi:simple sugar transport system permease protein/ribose transport system permease protein